jgi:hypothetical protein
MESSTLTNIGAPVKAAGFRLAKTEASFSRGEKLVDDWRGVFEISDFSACFNRSE